MDVTNTSDRGTPPPSYAPGTSMLLDRIRELLPDLRKSERRVAEAILGHASLIAGSTLADLAQRAGVSEPSVVRFCRTVGSEGFSDFKLRLVQSLATGVPYIHRDVRADEPTPDLCMKICGRSINTLLQLRTALDPAAIERAIGILAAARRIEFYGAGSSGVVAADAQHKFLQLGAATVAYADPHLHIASAATLAPGDAVVVISYTGATQDILDSARIAMESGADVIGITRAGSPLTEWSTVALLVAVSEDEDLYTPMAARLAFLTIIDILAVGVALRRGPTMTQRLEKLRRLLKRKRFQASNP
jgi:RpiR family transcriptional regulator, carbohydrate utilization regulator